MADMADEFVKCQVCNSGMRMQHAAAHIELHRQAGDLIRAASRQERAELEAENDR